MAKPSFTLEESALLNIFNIPERRELHNALTQSIDNISLDDPVIEIVREMLAKIANMTDDDYAAVYAQLPLPTLDATDTEAPEAELAKPII